MAAAAARLSASCGSLFQPGRRFCSHLCAVEATRKRQAISCAQCGVKFHPRKDNARFCSRSCAAKHKHATGTLRHFPRKLTAARLDHALAPRRPKRRYVQRLTPARLDRLLAGR